MDAHQPSSLMSFAGNEWSVGARITLTGKKDKEFLHLGMMSSQRCAGGFMASQTEIPPPVLGLPSCPQCGTRMLLIRILPERRGYESRTYECPRCEYEITEVIPLR